MARRSRRYRSEWHGVPACVFRCDAVVVLILPNPQRQSFVLRNRSQNAILCIFATYTRYRFNYNNVAENTFSSSGGIFFAPDEFTNVQIIHQCDNTEFGSTGVVSSTLELAKTLGTKHSIESGASGEAIGMGIGSMAGGGAEIGHVVLPQLRDLNR